MDIRRVINNCDGLEKKLSFLCYGNDTISKHLDYEKNWENHLIQIANLHLKDDSVILDIGANIGIWSISLAIKQRKIYSFEPFKASYMTLCGNVFLNKVENNVFPYNMALTDDISKNYDFKLDDEFNIGGIRLVSNEGTISSKITLSTIDILGLEKLDLIKVDVEGHEYNVLRGGLETIKKFKPIIFFECWIRDSHKEEREKLFNFIEKELEYEIRSLRQEWRFCDDFIALPYTK